MKKLLTQLGGIFLLIAKGTMGFLAGAVGILASSARTTPADDELSSAIRGGVFNHRTGKLDDGTDPYGWNEVD
jgi:hypothetical protein